MRIAWFPFVVGAALLFVGCAGAGPIGGALGVLLLGASLLVACVESRPGAQANDGAVADADGSDTGGCSGEMMSMCVDGANVPVCCPLGSICNYGWTYACNGVCVTAGTPCTDTVEPSETVSDVDDADVTCDGVFENGCVEGQIVALCCPVNVECNYGQNLVDCGDGTCVESPATCP